MICGSKKDQQNYEPHVERHHYRAQLWWALLCRTELSNTSPNLCSVWALLSKWRGLAERGSRKEQRDLRGDCVSGGVLTMLTPQMNTTEVSSRERLRKPVYFAGLSEWKAHLQAQKKLCALKKMQDSPAKTLPTWVMVSRANAGVLTQHSKTIPLLKADYLAMKCNFFPNRWTYSMIRV